MPIDANAAGVCTSLFTLQGVRVNWKKRVRLVGVECIQREILRDGNSFMIPVNEKSKNFVI